MMFPPMVAIFRSWPDAANSKTFGDDRETGPYVQVRCHIAHSRERAQAKPTVMEAPRFAPYQAS